MHPPDEDDGSVDELPVHRPQHPGGQEVNTVGQLGSRVIHVTVFNFISGVFRVQIIHFTCPYKA